MNLPVFASVLFSLSLSLTLIIKQEQSQALPPAINVQITQCLSDEIDQKRVKRAALIVGNSDYQNVGILRNPVNDANDVAEALQELDYDVIKVLNADKRQMDNALVEFKRKLAQGGVGVFYYAGHGIHVQGENYLIPIDAQLCTEQDAAYEAFPIGKVQNAMKQAKIDTKIIILDACRNNPFNRQWNRTTEVQGLAPLRSTGKGFYIMFATEPGSVAKDGQDRNGTFTSHLLKHIRTPKCRIEDLSKLVREGVMQETNDIQVPWDSSCLVGEFSLTDF